MLKKKQKKKKNSRKRLFTIGLFILGVLAGGLFITSIVMTGVYFTDVSTYNPLVNNYKNFGQFYCKILNYSEEVQDLCLDDCFEEYRIVILVSYEDDGQENEAFLVKDPLTNGWSVSCFQRIQSNYPINSTTPCFVNNNPEGKGYLEYDIDTFRRENRNGAIIGSIFATLLGIEVLAAVGYLIYLLWRCCRKQIKPRKVEIARTNSAQTSE